MTGALSGWVEGAPYALLRLLNVLWPKCDRLVLFVSEPDGADNPRALHDYLVTQETGWQARWLFYDKGACSGDLSGERWATPGGVLLFLRARVVVTSHNQLAGASCFRQLYVSLGHGIYLKTMGYLKIGAGCRQTAKQRRRLERARRRIDLMAATSELHKVLLAAFYRVDQERIVVTGFPRMDRQGSTDQQVEASGWTGRRVLLYAPTHRNDEICDTRQAAEYRRRLQALHGSLRPFLEETGAVLVVKSHQYDGVCREWLEGVAAADDRVVDFESFFGGRELAAVLEAVDTLITDYSSIFLETIFLDKPVVFYQPDHEFYETSRGLILQPLTAWLPGPVCRTPEEVVRTLSEDDAGERYADDRKRVKSLFFAHNDAGSSARVWSIIQERLPRPV